MSGELHCSKLEGLAERLLALSAGDACLCCGAAMELRVGPVGASSLMCRACGCELQTEEWPQRSSRQALYCLAA